MRVLLMAVAALTLALRKKQSSALLFSHVIDHITKALE
jgi:hypothetical protein